LLSNPNLSLQVLMIKEEEERRFDGKRGWRRRGWVTEERRLLEVVDERVFEASADWLGMLPDGLESFTVGDLVEAMGISTDLAGKMAYFLRYVRATELIGKRGRAHLYRRRELVRGTEGTGAGSVILQVKSP